LRCGLRYLDELDAVKEKERLDKENAKKRELSAVDKVEPSATSNELDLSVADLSQADWQTVMDSFGGTPLVSPGS